MSDELKWSLGFHFSPNHFAQRAENLIETETHNNLYRIEQNLRDMKARLSAIAIQIPKAMKSTYTLFIETFQKNPEALTRVFASSQRLNLLTYALSYQPSESASVIMNDSAMMAAALSLYQKNWSSFFWKGMIYSLLYGWHYENRSELQNLLKGCLNKQTIAPISDEDSRLITMIEQNRPYLLHQGGAMILGKHAAEQQWLWQEIPSQLELLPAFIKSSFFYESLPIYALTLVKETKLAPCFGALSEYLNQMRKSAHTLYVLSVMILSVERFLKGAQRNSWQERLTPLVQRLIGTHDNELAWRPHDIHGESESEKIRQARVIFGRWIIRHFFRFFFESLASDDKRNERYQFWQQYINYVEDFKIFVNDDQYDRMSRNEEMRPYLGSKIAELSDRNNNVLVMMIQGFMMVEFSQSGAFYAYNRNQLSSLEIPDISKRRMRSDEFKQTELFRNDWGSLVNYLGSDKARRGHTGSNWEQDITDWLRIELNCYPQAID